VWPVSELADHIAALEGIEGVTLSGGEPFAQPRSLVRFLDRLRGRRPELSAMSYSGFTLRQLLDRGADARCFLDRLDILIDGQYVQTLHADLLWRGSKNQAIHFLSSRYADLEGKPDRSAGLEMEVTTEGILRWSGVPSVAGFPSALARQLASHGVVLKRREEQ
jgi:anaerobic ribonucleoside-triphosphate reductase activating protein